MDQSRKDCQAADPTNKKAMHLRYKKLRNRTTALQRKDNVDLNVKRMEEAKNPSEIWNIVNDINKPREEQTWKLNEEGTRSFHFISFQ